MKRDTTARRDNTERESVRRFNATLHRECEKREHATASGIKATVRACMRISEQFIAARIAYGFPARHIATEALATFSTEFVAAGMSNDNAGETVKAFATAVSKYHWRSLHAGRDGKGRSRIVETMASDRADRDAQLGVYIGKPECLLLLLQSLIERNTGKDDATVLRALQTAREWNPPSTAPDEPMSATRSILDVSATPGAHRAAQSTFTVHKSGQAPEIHKAA